MNRRACFQDGPDFYDEAGGHIDSYPEIVLNDYDLPGAVRARERFLREHTDCFMVDQAGESA